MEEIRVDVKGGYIRVNPIEEPDYHGVDIEFVPDDYDGTTSNPRILFEQPIDSKGIKCRALIWEDKHEEDYTTEIKWEE